MLESIDGEAVSTMYRADVPEPTLWAISPNEWEDGTPERYELGIGPFDSAEDAHAYAGTHIMGVDYCLIRLVKP